MINGKVEISLEDWTKIDDQVQRLESQNMRLNERINQLIDIYGKMGIPECVVQHLGVDVNLSCRYTDDVASGKRVYRIDFEVPREVFRHERD